VRRLQLFGQLATWLHDPRMQARIALKGRVAVRTPARRERGKAFFVFSWRAVAGRSRGLQEGEESALVDFVPLAKLSLPPAGAIWMAGAAPSNHEWGIRCSMIEWTGCYASLPKPSWLLP